MMFLHTFSVVLLALPFTLATKAERPKYTSCGSRGMKPCAPGFKCIDNPYRPASRSCGMSCDIPGICVPETGSGSVPVPRSHTSVHSTPPVTNPSSGHGSGAGASCGGFMGSPCSGGLKCVQARKNQYCSDCMGVCV
ncbi:hypothetical protein RB595_002779 [Gaeumannomyces hyphopodioides]